MNRQYLLILIFISVLSGGCATITVPAMESYAINISCETDKSSEKKAVVSKVLKVSMPKSAAAIMSRHILYQEKEFSQNPYAHSGWIDTPNKMLGSLFLSCINKRSIFKAVLPSYSKGKSDFLLESTISEFYHYVNSDGSSDGSSEGRVRIEFYLIELKSSEVIATKEFISKITSKSFDANGGVRALNDASMSVSLRLTQWLSTLDVITGDKASASERQTVALQEQHNDLVTNITLQVRQYWLDAQETSKRIRVTQKAIAQAEENLKVNRDRYEDGLSTNTEVLDAETLRTCSQNNHTNAIYDAVLAALRLKSAVGEL